MRPLQHALLWAACQKKHWEEGGHDQLCKKIKRGGGAEQYHADNQVRGGRRGRGREMRGRHGGPDVLHLHAGRPLEDDGRRPRARMRVWRSCGTAGVAHVSCLAEQAKILCDEAEENNLDGMR